MFGADSGFQFRFRFWVPRDSTRSEPAPLPSLNDGEMSQTIVVEAVSMMVDRVIDPTYMRINDNTSMHPIIGLKQRTLYLT